MRVLLASAALLLTSPALADDAERDGAWFGLGLGIGAHSLAPDALAGAGAVLGNFRGGYAVRPDLLVGAELGGFGQYNAWEERAHLLSAQSNVYATGWYFPSEDTPIHTSLGLGWASVLQVRRGPDFGGDNLVGADGYHGLGWLLGFGMDFTGGLGGRLRYDGAVMPDLGSVHGVGLELSLNVY